MSKNFFSMGLLSGLMVLAKITLLVFRRPFLYRQHQPPFYIYSFYLFDALGQAGAGFFPLHII